MPYKKKIINTVLTLQILLTTLIPSFNINAYTVNGDGAGNSVTNKEVPCSTYNHTPNPYEGCGTFNSYFAVRITLIDKNGKRVPGTKTIEFRNTTQKDLSSKEVEMKPQEQTLDLVRKTTESENQPIAKLTNTQIKFNDSNTSIYTLFTGTTMTDDEQSDQPIYEVKMFDNDNIEKENSGVYFTTRFEKSRQSFMKYLESEMELTKRTDSTEKVTLLDFFFKVSGFIDSRPDSEISAEDKQNWRIPTGYYTKNETKDYKLLIEPVYQIFYREDETVRVIEGTAKQIVQFIAYNLKQTNKSKYPFTDWVSNRGSQFFNYACNFYEKNNKIGKTGVGTTTCSNETNFKQTFNALFATQGKVFTGFWNNKANAANSLYEMGSKNNLYGANVINIGDIIKEEVNCVFKLNYCSNNGEDSSDVSFQLTSDTNMNLNECQHRIPGLNNKIGNNSQCYEEVEYKIGNITSELKNKKILPNTFINVPSINVTKNSICYKQGQADEANINPDINLTLLGKKYEINEIVNQNQTLTGSPLIGPKTNKITYNYTLTSNRDSYGTDGKLELNISNQTPTTTEYTKEITLESDDKYSKYILIKEGYSSTEKESNKVEITGSNLFGTNSTKIIEALKNGPIELNFEKPGAKVKYIYSLEIDGDSTSCYFTPQTGITNTSQRIENVKFRTISLEFPFPARDGTTRLAGSNWLTEDSNNVYKYITNNRGVQYGSTKENPNKVYDTEPLYSIKLTPKTMIAIREYNKKHNYSDYNLRCEEETGKACWSTFLHSEISGNEDARKVIPEKNDIVTGKCGTTIGIPSAGIQNYVNCISNGKTPISCNTESNFASDLDGDGELTTNDVSKALAIQGTAESRLKTFFYACADKSIESGGPNVNEQ